MSYHPTVRYHQRRVRRVARRASGRRALGDSSGTVLGFLSDALSNMSPLATGANATVAASCYSTAVTVIANYDSQISDIQNNTSFGPIYDPNQLVTAVNAVVAMITQCQNTINQIASSSTITPLVVATVEFTALNAQASNYVDYAQQALSAGSNVEADDFHDWAINAMQLARDSVYAMYNAQCQLPALAALVNVIAQAFTAVYNALKAIAAFVLDAAKDILQIPSALATIVEYGVIGFGLYLIYELFVKKKATA